MSCEACEGAETNPRSGLYIAGCLGCSARALAQAPSFFDSYVAQKLTPGYMVQLHGRFGSEWEAGHKAVRAWSEKLKGAT